MVSICTSKVPQKRPEIVVNYVHQPKSMCPGLDSNGVLACRHDESRGTSCSRRHDFNSTQAVTFSN